MSTMNSVVAVYDIHSHSEAAIKELHRGEYTAVVEANHRESPANQRETNVYAGSAQ
jgi:hypothetical protein